MGNLLLLSSTIWDYAPTIIMIGILLFFFVAIIITNRKQKNAANDENAENSSIKNTMGGKEMIDFSKQNLTPTQKLEQTPGKLLKSKTVEEYGYYRYQEDKQPIVERTKEQANIFERYFVVPNLRTTECEPSYKKTYDILKILRLLAFIAGAIFAIWGIIAYAATEELWQLILGIALLAGGVVCHFLGNSYLNKFRKSIKISDAPKNLMSDSEYEALVEKKLNDMKVVNLGLERLGLDPDQVREIKPIILKDKVISDISLRVYNKTDDTLHSSTQYVTLLYFTDTELFVYKLQFDMCCNAQEKWTSEFFYEDICDISTYVDRNVIEFEDTKCEYCTVAFNIIASNSSIGFEMPGDSSNVNSIQAMKQKIRDRRNK